MVEATGQERIWELERRLELEPGSRLFVALAEEYRQRGQLADALATLQRGLRQHPGYVSAHVALGRVCLEVGQVEEAIEAFSKALQDDPGNLVSAKSLADLYLSRGEKVEAIKKYKLYRAISGDRSVDEVIGRLERELGPPPGAAGSREPGRFHPPSPPPLPGKAAPPLSLPAPLTEPFDVSDLSLEPGGEAFSTAEEEPFPLRAPQAPLSEVPPRPLSPAHPGDEAVTRAIRVSDYAEAFSSPEPALPSFPPAAPVEPPSPPPKPQGRALADLYFAQGHYAEALRIYDELAALHPFDEELKRMRRDAEARLLPAGPAPEPPAADRALERRLGRIRALKRWLSMLQIG